MTKDEGPTTLVVTAETIRSVVRGLRLEDQALCVHASLRSFGRVVEGATTIVHALLAEGGTVMMPTFSTADYEVWPAPHDLNSFAAVGPRGTCRCGVG